ncbi:EpsG family protein, partial [Enterococcus faecium]|nr:EpsG family protein [Enterococcus faecium]
MMMLFFLLYCFFISILFRKKSNFSLLISLLPFFLFGSLRHFSVGNDSIEYARVYQIISSSGSDIFKQRYELGFLKLNEILSSISNSYTLLFIVTMAITVYALYVMLRDYSLMPGMAISMYFLLRYYDMSLNVMRLSIAIALTILATCQLLKNKRSSFILLVILASMFHRTALIYLIAIFIWNFKVKISKKILLLLCGSVSILLVIFDFLIKVVVKFFPIY